VLIPRFWERAEGAAVDPGGRRLALRVWGWSQQDRREAAARARERLAAAIASVARGSAPPGGYPYARAPLREEIVRSLGETGARDEAVVTRNRYGALILNTAQVPFIDVDLPARGRLGFLTRLFRRGPRQDPTLERIRRACAALGGDPCRVYRTRAGYRVLVTGRLLDPKSDETRALLQGFEADPHFVRLCRLQASFRARLTPKPWRCGCAKPPGQHPRSDSAARDFATWLAAYESASQGFATCRYLETVGSGWERSEAAPVVEEHDRVSKAQSDLPLA